MAERETIIIDVQMAEDAAKNLAATTAEMQRLKDEQKQLSQFMKTGADTTGELSRMYAENSQRLRELKAEEKTYTAQLNNSTSEQREYGSSIHQLSAQLADLKNQYRGLTKEQRESAEGQKLLKNIQSLDKEVKGLDADLGDHQRNVGNYVSALTGLDNRVVKVAAVFQGGFKQGLQTATAAVKSFGKALLTTPLGWILAGVAAVVAVFGKLRDAFKRSDDAGTALGAAMAKLQPIMTGINKAFEFLANVTAKVVSGITGAISAVLGLIPAFRQASDAAEELVIAQDKLEDKQREYTIDSAKRQAEISELNKKARTDLNLTAAEREQYYRQIDELEKKDLEERKEIAAENLRIIEARYAQEVDTSDEAKNKIAEARAELYRAETEYNNGTLRFAQRQAQAIKEQIEAVKAEQQARRQAYQEYKRQQEERNRIEIDELRKLQDLRLQLIKDDAQRQRQEITLQYTRQIEDLKNRLKTEKNLTAEARQAINEQIMLLASQLDEELRGLSEAAAEERADRELRIFEDKIDLETSLLQDQSERERKTAEENYRQRRDAIIQRLKDETDLSVEARQALNEQLILLQRQLDGELGRIGKEQLRKEFEEQRREKANQLERLLLDAYDSEREQGRVRLEAAQEYYDTLRGMDSETKAALFENEEQYTAAVLEAERSVMDARSANSEILKKQAEEFKSTMTALTGSFSELFGAVAGDTAEYEQFKKAMAIVDATISLGTAIANATAIQATGDPYTMAIRIAGAVTQITAAFAAVIASIKSATIPTAPAFAGGGIVEGNSLTGDTIGVRANAGEMFINKEQQKRLFDFIANGMPAGNFELMKAAFAYALREMPAPVLDYSEFTGFQRSVKMIEKRTKLL